jgi:hypothetical protein
MLRASNVASFWWPGSIGQGSSRQMTASRDDEDRPCKEHLRSIIQAVVLLIYVGLTSVSMPVVPQNMLYSSGSHAEVQRSQSLVLTRTMVAGHLVTHVGNIRLPGVATRIVDVASTYDWM